MQHSLACVRFGGKPYHICKPSYLLTTGFSVLDVWKLYWNDGDISDIDTDQRVDHYWNTVFLLTSVEGNGRYQLLPRLVKSCLNLAHANADSERSLSVNARVVTKERSRLGEQTIVGLRLLKDAVKFHDPVNCRPEKIPVTKEMRKSVRLAHSAYKARLDQEKEEKKKELEAETMRKKEEEEKLKKEKEKLLKSRERGEYFKGREESKRRFRSCR